jgi:2-haloacid dehalogenase
MTGPGAAPSFQRFRALTFDCYGTLIDWERGLLAALRALLRRQGVPIDDERLLHLYAAFETEAEAGPYAPYRVVLRRVMVRMAAAMSFPLEAGDEDCLSASIGDWPAFPDTVAALRALKTRYRLAIASNIDDDLFAATRPRLGVEFDAVVTAQQVRSYKPAPAHFTAALERLALSPGDVLHVAQSLFHDVAPAKSLGMTTVWVNRRAGRPGFGATPPADALPDLEVPDLRTLAALVESSLRAT